MNRVPGTLNVIALVAACDLPDQDARFEGDKLVDLAGRALHNSERVDDVVVVREQGWQPATRDADVLVVHDPACALTPVAVIRSAIDTVLTGAAQAAVPAEPVTDTIKVADSSNALSSTWDRHRLRSIQSPLCLRTELATGLRRVPTIDDLPYERVRLVPGDPLGIRLHSQFDMLVAETLASGAFGDG